MGSTGLSENSGFGDTSMIGKLTEVMEAMGQGVKVFKISVGFALEMPAPYKYNRSSSNTT
jgi:hypothetical protein